MKKRNRVALFNMLSTFLLQGISIITAPLFSRLLGTGGYGVVSNFNIWSNIAATVGTAQTFHTLPNARIEYPEEEQRRYQSSAMSLSLTLFLGVSAVIVLLLPWISGLLRMSRWMILLILVQAFGMFCVNFLNYKLTYELKAGRNMLVSVGVALVTLGLSLALVLSMPEENRYYGRILGNVLVYGLLGPAICIWLLARGRCGYNPAYWKFCLVLAVPLALQSLSDMLLGHSDLLMLRQMKGDSASGLYGLAYNFGGVMFAIFTALNKSWVPFFFEENRKNNRERVKQQARNFTELYTVLSMGFVLLSAEVYRVFANKDFWPGTGLIPVFVTSYYLNFLCTFPVNYEYYYKKTKIVAAATIAASILNIGINWLLIPPFGIMGAAVASCISHCIQFALHYYYATHMKDKGEYPFGLRMWLGYGLAYGLCVALFYLAPEGWLLRWGLGALIGLWEIYRIKKRKVLI